MNKRSGDLVKTTQLRTGETRISNPGLLAVNLILFLFFHTASLMVPYLN